MMSSSAFSSPSPPAAFEGQQVVSSSTAMTTAMRPPPPPPLAPTLPPSSGPLNLMRAPSLPAPRPRIRQSGPIKRERIEEPSSSIPDLDFDGTTVLCQVCGDKASGFHYGVHSCEGCKGFFRRSIQQKIQYKPCTKNQNCSILRINRNRCQYCRLKKCIAVGMSRDAVRFGRVPKREKAKILAAMQSVNQKYQERALLTELEDEGRMVRTVVQAHLDTCDFTWDKVSPLLQAARLQPNYAPGNAGMACPMSPRVVGADGQLCDSQLFGPHIKSVVEFAKQLPGFMRLPEEDRITLLKSSVFEVLLVWLACMFDNKTCTAACLNGQLVRRDGFPAGSQPRFLLDSMFNFAEQLNALRLGDAELGLFCACVVLTTERPGLRNTELIARIHHKLETALRGVIAQNHAQQGAGLFEQLKRKVHDLKTLNSLHSDMIRALKEPIQAAATTAGVVSAATTAAAGCFWPSELVRRRGEANSPQSSLSSGYVGSEEGSVRSPSAGGVMDCSPSPPNDGPTPPVASSHPHLVAALQPRPALQLLMPALAHLKTERPASCPSASPSPPAHPPQHPPQPAFVVQQQQESGNGMVKSESEDYMPLLKQALSKPSLQSVVGGPGGGSGSVEGAGPGGVVRGILDQAFVPHKKFRWMRCRDNNVDVDGDVDVNSEDEKMPVSSSPPCSAGSQTPTLSRILGAPPQRSWSTEEQRRREAVAHLLSLQAGGPLVFRAADPRSPSPPSAVGGHHVPVVPAPMPPHAGRRASPAPLCIVPPPAHSRSPTPASTPTPPPPSAQPSELQPLNLSKKVASQVQQPRITLEAS